MKRPQSYVRIAVAALAIAISFPSFAADAATTCPKLVNINTADATTISNCVTGHRPKHSSCDCGVSNRTREF